MGNPVRGVYRALLRPIYARLAQIEREQEQAREREQAPFNRRFAAIDDLADYLVGAEVPGDYLEFGVYIGRTFSHACKRMAPVFGGMRFFALDSFQGLPRPQGLDAAGGYSSSFYESQFACSEEEFLDNVRRAGVDMSRVRTVKGWFDRSLTAENAAAYGIDKVAAAWVDCDLYESTVPVLKFLSGRLSTGSVVLFDDWRCFRNSPCFGQQRACREWLAENPQMTLRELFSFGWHGVAFTVDLSDARC